MKLKAIKRLSGIIRVETGLHIGSGNETMEIGGIDNPVVKHPVTKEPYIPGSSLKGKMRALMEWKLGIVGRNNGNACGCGDCAVCRVFGAALSDRTAEQKAARRGPSRLIVRDAFISPECRAKYDALFLPLLEEKKENSLNRITAKAMPRSLERVIPGAEFRFELCYRVLDTDDDGAADEAGWGNVVLTALALLQADALGGGSSRGSGKVVFAELRDETGAPVALPQV